MDSFSLYYRMFQSIDSITLCLVHGISIRYMHFVSYTFHVKKLLYCVFRALLDHLLRGKTEFETLLLRLSTHQQDIFGCVPFSFRTQRGGS